MWRQVRLVLAGEHVHATERAARRGLVALVLAAGVVNGLAMGSLGFRPTAMLYGAIKLPILLVAGTVLCLPNLWVVHAVLGLRGEFRATVRGILSAQCVLALVAASLAPVVVFAYAAGATHPFALAANAVVFLLAAWCAQRALRRLVAPLVERAPRIRIVLVAWFTMHAFVSTKVGWILRPFVGDPALPVEFLRGDRWSEDPFANLFWTAAGLAASLARRLFD
jgi:hypothetical protein